MATRRRNRSQSGIIGGVKIDLRRLHEAWMSIPFRRQRGRGHSVLGKWKPETVPEKLAYYSWGTLGVVGLLIVYPIAVVGFATRFYARRLDSTATRLGFLGTLFLSGIVWGGLTALAHRRLPSEGVYAVAAASVVATVAALLAVFFKRVGGRGITVLLAHPFGVTAVFLPPVVAAFYYPPLQPFIFDQSDRLAEQLLNLTAEPLGRKTQIKQNLELEGVWYALMWFVASFPVGWTSGLLVSVANVVRPTDQ